MNAGFSKSPPPAPVDKATVSVVVPFYTGIFKLERCLSAVRRAAPGAEVILVADGSKDEYHTIATTHDCRLLEVPGPSGPAVARNRGAAIASGNTLVFVDSDVEVSAGALSRLTEVLDAHPDVSAIFGTYDESPAEQNFISQYKNLAHSYIHQSAQREARSFWAGLGAIRSDAFHTVGGFDERFTRPSIEDIELGYRLAEKGHRILLEPTVRGRHLKRWDLTSLVRTDVRDRAIPWTQLILRTRRFQNDLNLRWTDRLSVGLSYGVFLAAGLSVVEFQAAVAAALFTLALFVMLNRDFYRFFLEKRGPAFTIRVLPVHLLHYLCSGLSFIVGGVIFTATRATGSHLPGAIPKNTWNDRLASAALLKGDALRAQQ